MENSIRPKRSDGKIKEGKFDLGAVLEVKAKSRKPVTGIMHL
jgi:hypothetical protein